MKRRTCVGCGGASGPVCNECGRAVSEIGPSRVIVVAADFADGTRRSRVCSSVEEVRAFVHGENEFTGRYPNRVPVGRGREWCRKDLDGASSSEIASALRDVLA